MGIKKFKPISPGRRQMTVLSFEEISKSKPEKALTAPLKKTGGRSKRADDRTPPGWWTQTAVPSD